jgi:Protein of unknown function (Hypoth_ymh)
MPQEPNDNHQYYGVSIYGESVKFLIDALRFYAERLKQDVRGLHGDADLALFINPDTAISPLQREIERTERATKWVGEQWDKDEIGMGVVLNLSHGAVRFLKSVGASYLNFLHTRRDVLAVRLSSEAVLSEVDRRLARASELLNAGVFANATAVPLMVAEAEAQASDLGPQTEPATLPAVVPQPRTPVVVGKIDILDNTLNARCLDLFDMFAQGSQADRFDTVIMEATKILEDRLRRTANLDASHDGLKLVSAALGGATPLLRLSTYAGEQEAAHALFRGVFGFVRNPFHHRLVGTVAPQRIIQLLGTIDYLLFLLDSVQAQPTEIAPAQSD